LKRYYIGLAATMHDPALAILDPFGEPLFAEATERFMQCKRAYNCTPDDMIRIPQLVREYCEPDAELIAAITWSADHLAQVNFMVGSLPFLHHQPGNIDDHSWPLPDPASLFIALRNSISQASVNLAGSKQIPNTVIVKRYEHHLTHAANAVYTSPFEECAVAVIDAFGENSSTGFFHYRDGRLSALPTEIPGSGEPRSESLGFFYARLCALCGFDPMKGEEWKVMGLASYGEYDSRIYELLRPMIDVKDLTLRPGCSNADLLRRVSELRSTMRPPGSPPLQSADLACTGQLVFEEIMTDLLKNLFERGISSNLALSGGCALNSSYAGRILSRTGFTQLHIPSAPADDGNALGAAFLAYHDDHPQAAPNSKAQSPYLGSPIQSEALERMLRFNGLEKVIHAPDDIHIRAARLLGAGKIIGWVQGRAEFGPRALGNRSILADPRPQHMKDRINAEVKFREEFRPFAPSILEEYGAAWFEQYQPSVYMERTLRFREEVRDRVPAVVHVDGTGRLQSVRRDLNPRFYDLIKAFHDLTGIPLVLNTSLNIMGKPIAHSIEDVLGLFFTSGLDALVIEDYLIEK
jgi:carbamoyltransferase